MLTNQQTIELNQKFIYTLMLDEKNITTRFIFVIKIGIIGVFNVRPKNYFVSVMGERAFRYSCHLHPIRKISLVCAVLYGITSLSAFLCGFILCGTTAKGGYSRRKKRLSAMG